MTRDDVQRKVLESLREGFGRLLEVRNVRRVRRVAGDAWAVSVVIATQHGALHVADLTVDDAGTISPKLSADAIVEAIQRSEPGSRGVPSAPSELADFAGELEDDEVFQETDAAVELRVNAALARGDLESLREARDLLPRLLIDHEQRGRRLLTMATVENRLGEPKRAAGYLEAATREFADRFDLDALEKAATLALEIGGREAFAGSPVHTFLEQGRHRLRPLKDIFRARSFAGLPEALREELMPHLTLRVLAPGDVLVQEGEPSRQVFLVKSGIIGVWLEKPEGGSWLVRCCFPGWFLGESSVLGGPDARCMASLRAERVSEVWTCPAPVIRRLMAEDAAFAQRIAETRQMHRIDSFFSMHETMGQLDVHVRDEMLSCIQRVETFSDDTLILPANEIPTAACLVARGSIALYQDGNTDKPVAVVEADSFYGVRDTIHRIAPSLVAIARAGTTVAFFEGTRLQQLCERSPEQVIAVLERLG